MTDKELIVAVAEKVMGWRGWTIADDIPGNFDPKAVVFIWHNGLEVRHGLGLFVPWNPLENIADAWMLIDKLRLDGFEFEVSDGKRGFFCSLVSREERNGVDYEKMRNLHDSKAVMAPTAPRAITLAAIQATEREKFPEA